MSERVLACLLRVYPSRFREQYEQDALQFYRDRLHDETGVFGRARLWCDLLADIAMGLPQAWRNSYPETAMATLAPSADGIPSFRVLDEEPLRPASILAGASLSLATMVAFALVMRYATIYRPFSTSQGPKSPIELVLERLNQPSSPEGSEAPESGTAAAGALQAQPSPGPANSTSLLSVAALDVAERDRVIHGAAQNLNEHYVDRDKARQASESLLIREKQGDYDAFTDGYAFAARLTADLHNLTQDPHLNIEYSRTSIPKGPTAPSATAMEQYRAAVLQQNCTFERVEALPGNIGYLKLNSFPDPALCRATAEAAMAHLNGADAIIFDLRDNTGGYPDMVELMAARLFDHPVPWYNPRATSPAQSLTHSPVAGSKLANKPVYVLTSSRTLSGAEQFTYDLKMLGRATVIGENTGGGVHAGIFHRIDDHFGIGIPEIRVPNPYGKPDWEGIGVQPDVKVKAADALQMAEKVARVEVHTN